MKQTYLTLKMFTQCLMFKVLKPTIHAFIVGFYVLYINKLPAWLSYDLDKRLHVLSTTTVPVKCFDTLNGLSLFLLFKNGRLILKTY